MKEYVLTIAVRDSEHPLTDTVLIEAGQADAARFTEALSAVVDMLRLYGTPERVARFMRDNAEAAKAASNTLLLKGR